MSEGTAAGSRRGGRRVVVVGAGLAGLNAAWQVHRAGLDVVVLEARDRVGGRTWSATLADGTVVERGGEFIGPGDACLRGLCGELGLELIPHGFSFERRCAPGEVPPSEHDVAALFAAARARVHSTKEDLPADQVLPSPADRTSTENSIVRRIETSSTVPLSRVSARGTFGDTYHGYDPADRVRGGNDSVARELARRLEGRVRLRTQVVGVDYRGDVTSIRLEDGSELEAAAVVLALPLPLLLKLDLTPGLPAPIVAAARRLPFGDAAKLHLRLQGSAPPGGVASSEGLWWCWVSAADGDRSGAPVLSGFAGGTAAIERLGLEVTLDQWAQAALALRPDVRAADHPPLVTHWGAQEWTGGSYSSPGVGMSEADELAWGRTWGPLAFAGEHTAGAGCGTMNGAAWSGERAGQAVVNMLGHAAHGEGTRT